MRLFGGLFSIFLAFPALVQADEAAAQGHPMNQLLFFAVLFGAFYFFMIRPQSKKAKEHKNLIANVAKGDEVVTTGGILGTVNKVTDAFFVLSVSEGVDITVQKNSIATCLPKGTLKSV